VAPDIGAEQTEHGCAHEPEETDADRSDERLSQDAIIDDLPSPFVVEWLPRIAARTWDPPSGGPIRLKPDPTTLTALDLAMGRGRHAQLLARAGFRTFGVDVKLDAVRTAVGRARSEGLIVRGWCADLTETRLPRGFFDVVLVTRYLQRDLFPSIREMVKSREPGGSGGFIVYETFTINQRRLGFGPASPDHLLVPGELQQLFEGFEVLFYEEVDTPEAVARIVARRGA
jgi:tellurite methyltransferase